MSIPSLKTVELTDITIEYLEPDERDFYADCYRVRFANGKGWTLTLSEMKLFRLQLACLQVPATNDHARD